VFEKIASYIHGARPSNSSVSFFY